MIITIMIMIRLHTHSLSSTRTDECLMNDGGREVTYQQPYGCTVTVRWFTLFARCITGITWHGSMVVWLTMFTILIAWHNPSISSNRHWVWVFYIAIKNDFTVTPKFVWAMYSTPDSKAHGAHLGPTGSRWVPCWPHELCYLGPHSPSPLSNWPLRDGK